MQSGTASLQDLVDSLDFQHDEYRSYFDRQTGRIVSVELSILSTLEEGVEADLDDIPDWQKSEIEIARAIVADRQDRFIDPPDRFDFHEYRHMEEFIDTIDNIRVATQLAISIRGEGAFGRFKDTLRNFGIEDQWYEYRAQAMKEFVIEWAKENDIAFQDDLRQRRNKKSPRSSESF